MGWVHVLLGLGWAELGLKQCSRFYCYPVLVCLGLYRQIMQLGLRWGMRLFFFLFYFFSLCFWLLLGDSPLEFESQRRGRSARGTFDTIQ